MEIQELEKNNNIDINIEKEKNQKSFLETTLGKTINAAVDIGIRALLPDFIEDQAINLKDNLIEYGLKDGIKQTIDDAINVGKSAIGIVTGDFKDINQIQSAIEAGGLIDGVSSLLDTVIEKVNRNGLINSSTANIITKGKDVILDNISNNIEQTFKEQISSIENTNKYMNNWKEYYSNKDFEGMEKEYNKLEEELTKLIPIENTINQARTIENLHNLIKNNGRDFNLPAEAIELAQKI